jgi:hypothetical protein
MFTRNCTRNLHPETLFRLVEAMLETLYPPGDVDAEWSVDMLEELTRRIPRAVVRDWIDEVSGYEVKRERAGDWTIVAEHDPVRARRGERSWAVHAVHRGGDQIPLGPNMHDAPDGEIARLKALIDWPASPLPARPMPPSEAARAILAGLSDADRARLDGGLLDEEVIDVFSERAASVNNDGAAGQLAFLVESEGETEARATVTRALAPRGAAPVIPEIPSRETCIAEGTHGIKCTADGACKRCFS